MHEPVEILKRRTQAVALSATILTFFLHATRVAATFDPRTDLLWKQLALREAGFLERAESMLWAIAVVLGACLVLANLRRRAGGGSLGWLLFLWLLSLFAFGEETGWGQTIVGFRPPAWFLEHNVQGDLTLHNLDVASFLGLPPGSPYRGAFLEVFNAAPYAFCLGLWIGLPLMQRAFSVRWLSAVALPGPAVAGFLAANLALYLVTNRVWGDTAEIFELSIAITFALAFADLLHRFRPASQGATPCAASPAS